MIKDIIIHRRGALIRAGRARALYGAGMTNRRCKICDRLLSTARLKRSPRAKLCGKTECAEEHHRRYYKLDPAWKADENRKAVERHRLKRKAARRVRSERPTSGD